MNRPETCGAVRDGWEEDPCRRTKSHKGKHRSRRATWYPTAAERQKTAPYRRYVAPHRRPEGAPEQEYTGRRYRRPSTDSDVQLAEYGDSSATSKEVRS